MLTTDKINDTIYQVIQKHRTGAEVVLKTFIDKDKTVSLDSAADYMESLTAPDEGFCHVIKRVNTFFEDYLK